MISLHHSAILAAQGVVAKQLTLGDPVLVNVFTGTPNPIIAKLNREIVKVLETPEVKEAFFRQGMLAQTSTPEAFRAYIKSEIEAK